MNIIDAVIGWLNPRAGLSRMVARQQLARAHEAASPRDSWRPRRAGASANADHMADATVMRAKARALVQNVAYVGAAIDALVSYTIGSGIVPRATGKDAQRLNALWSEWAKVCDADGVWDIYGLQALAYRAKEVDGEVLIRLRSRRPEDGLPVPMQIQVLEIDWLDSARTEMRGGNQIVNGIEYDPLGRKVFYWLFDQHPGDVTLGRGNRSTSRPVPAENIIHLYSPKRPGQGRGFTRLAPVIVRTRDMQLYEDAELGRKNLETRLSVLYSGDASQMADPPAGTSSADAQSHARQTGELGQLGSASITELPAGGTIQVVEPKAAPGYTDYVAQQLHIIAAGIGVPYEMMTGDMEGVNFSSARVRRLDYRKAVQQEQWLVVIPMMLEPIWHAFCKAAALAHGLSKPDGLVDYAVPKWDYVNPEQDVKSDQLEIETGLSSISEKLRQRGYEPASVFSELESDMKKLRDLGLLDVLPFFNRNKGQVPSDPAKPTPPSK